MLAVASFKNSSVCTLFRVIRGKAGKVMKAAGVHSVIGLQVWKPEWRIARVDHCIIVVTPIFQ